MGMQHPLPFQLQCTFLDSLQRTKSGQRSMQVLYEVYWLNEWRLRWLSLYTCRILHILLLFLSAVRCKKTLGHIWHNISKITKLQSAEHMLYYCNVKPNPWSWENKAAMKTGLSQKSGINMRGLRGDLIVSSAAGPWCRFHNKVWWGTHGVAVVTHNSGHIFPTALFVDHNASPLLPANQMHTSKRVYSVDTSSDPTILLWADRVDRSDSWGIHFVCLHVFFNEMDRDMNLNGKMRSPKRFQKLGEACYGT